MSGPIVRKYGFPNFDKIFGERPLQHGAAESEATKDEGERATGSAEDAGSASEKKPSAAKAEKNAP
jgi:hypothetical protein